MPGYGSHTYQWINAAGERFWVKYHFHALQGNEEMHGAEAEQIAGADADYYRRDLYEAIERGDFPAWKVSVQVMPYEDAKTYRFNPFDLTKVWPHEDYPLIEVGMHTLNRNPENFFAADRAGGVLAGEHRSGHRHQPRQDADGAGLLVPGRAALPGGHQLQRAPGQRAGRPGAQLLAGRRGAATASSRRDAPVYAPNSFGGPVADAGARRRGLAGSPTARCVRSAATLHSEDDDFGQAGTLYREVYDAAAKERFLDTIAGAVSGVKRERSASGPSSTGRTSTRPSARPSAPAWPSPEQTPDEAAEYVGVAD